MPVSAKKRQRRSTEDGSDSNLVDASVVAEHLGVSKRTVNRYAAENKIPSYPAGFRRGTGFRRGARAFDLAEVDAALKVAA